MATSQDFVTWTCGPRLRPRFLLWCLRGLRDEILAWTQGSTHKTIYMPDIEQLRVPLPELPVQDAVADFLDAETARIDTLIAKKRRMLELLKEKCTALTSQAVTKGIDLSVSMKDSGVAWLGKIPTHWKVKRIKWVARMESGHTPDRKVDAYWENGDVPWVSLSDTGYLKDHDYIAQTALYTNELGLRNSSARLLPARTLVFSRDATIGRCAITELPMAVSQHFIAWVCGNEMCPEYLLRVFDTMEQELERLTMGATLRTIGMPEVGALVTAVPPVTEQEAIVEHLQIARETLGSLVTRVEATIERMREFRSALITAAVTGELEIPGAAA
jgi:type I restriction enzyme S subunit